MYLFKACLSNSIQKKRKNGQISREFCVATIMTPKKVYDRSEFQSHTNLNGYEIYQDRIDFKVSPLI